MLKNRFQKTSNYLHLLQISVDNHNDYAPLRAIDDRQAY